MHKIIKTQLLTLNQFIKLQGEFNVDIIRRVDGHDEDISAIYTEIDDLRKEVISSSKGVIKILNKYLKRPK